MSNWEETATKEYWDAWDNGSRTAVEMLDAMLTTLDKILKQEKLDLLNRLSYLVDGGMYLEFAIERIQKEIKEGKQ